MRGRGFFLFESGLENIWSTRPYFVEKAMIDTMEYCGQLMRCNNANMDIHFLMHYAVHFSTVVKLLSELGLHFTSFVYKPSLSQGHLFGSYVYVQPFPKFLVVAPRDNQLTSIILIFIVIVAEGIELLLHTPNYRP